MPRFTRITRTATAALAITALAAPTALARPIQDVQSDAQDAAAQAQTRQDFRSPDTRDAATRPHPRVSQPDINTSSLAGTTSPKGDVFWSYDYPAGKPGAKPVAVAPSVVRPTPVPATGDDTDTPWATIGIAIAAAMLGGAGGAVATSRTRRSHAAV
jgi:LPXTG-motif cell wall-anchored protein